MTALSVKYIRELLMSLIPRAGKGTDGQYSEPLVNGIVVGGTDKHATNARTLIEGIGMVNTHDVAVKRELQSANKFLTIIGKHLAASIRSLNLCLHIGRKGTTFLGKFSCVSLHNIIIYRGVTSNIA